MGIKRWRNIFSEINCLEKSNDKPEDWRSNERCSMCNLINNSQSITNQQQFTNQSSNLVSSLKCNSSSMTTTPIMTNNLNDSDHLNSFNNLISNENMANQNDNSLDNSLQESKVVCIFQALFYFTLFDTILYFLTFCLTN